MTSRKRKDRSRRQRESQRKRKGSKPRSREGQLVPGPEAMEPPSLAPPDLARCYPPIHVEQGARRVPDPWLQLGLESDGAHTLEEVREAWRRAIEQHPPEREPEIARALTDARDRLLAPEMVIERRLGVLRSPDPKAYGLPVESRPKSPGGQLGSWPRLLGQLCLYALLEEELTEGGPKRSVQEELPF